METILKKPWYKKWWIILIIVTGVLFVILLVVPTTEEVTAPNTPVEPTIEELENVPKVPPPEEEAKIKAELHYEVLKEDFQGSVATITVFTTDKEDEKIIGINDELLEKYKEGRTHIFINYYDDKVADPTTSHYIAKFIYNTTNEYKELVKIKDSTEIKLKSY